MIPRYKLYDLCVRTYDAEDSNYTEYVDIITSEYDPETGKCGQLGTVFSIRAYDGINGITLEEARAIRFDGASRVCFFPTNTGNSHPQQIEALTGFQSNTRANFWPGHYLNKDSVSMNYSGIILTSCGSTVPDRFYLTTVYLHSDNGPGVFDDHSIEVLISTDPTFQGDWVATIGLVVSDLIIGTDLSTSDWVMSYVTAVPYTGGKLFKGSVSAVKMFGTVDTVQKFMGQVSTKRFAGTVSRAATVDTAPSDVPEVIASVTGGVLYIKKATAVLNGDTLEVK